METHASPPPPQVLANPEPATIKTLGIIHIVLGGVGIFYALFQIASLVFQEKIQELSQLGGSTPQQEMINDWQKEFTAQTQSYSIVLLVASVILSILIIIAGIKLVKKRKTAVKASNLYAYASILLKIITFVLFFVWLKPIMDAGIGELLESTGGVPSPELKIMKTTMSVTMTIAGVVMPLLYMIYPVLSLVLLNKPAVKNFLAEHGS